MNTVKNRDDYYVPATQAPIGHIEAKIMGSPTRQQVVAKVKAAFNQDPRADLTDDSNDWRALLGLAFAFDGEVNDGCFNLLLGARCIGMRFADGKLTPRDESAGDWPALRSQMVARKGEIAAILSLASRSSRLTPR